MIDPLHNRQDDNVPKAEPCSLLCSNNDVMHGSAFGFSNKEPTIEQLINALSEIIIDAYVFSKQSDSTSEQKSGNIL